MLVATLVVITSNYNLLAKLATLALLVVATQLGGGLLLAKLATSNFNQTSANL
jgi:hypothetical protein